MAQQGASGGQAAGVSQGSAATHRDRTFWRDRVNEWYPRWRERTYFVPPVIMYRTDHDTVQVAGEDVRVPKPPVSNLYRGSAPALRESDVLDDQTQQRVLHCLRKLSEVQNEVMFVLSNLRFEHYLSERCFAAAAKTLPRPVDLKEENQDKGDFDILIIHRKYGILACEIKAVGTKFSSPSPTEQQKLDLIEKKVREEAIKQLDKLGSVLSYLVFDMPSPPPIQKTLILPNVSTTQLRQVLDNSPKLLQDLCQCLGVQRTTDPVPLCVTSDQLSDMVNPHDVTDSITRQLEQWWQARMSGVGTVSLSDDIYLELLARFSGPATTVQVFCGGVRPRLYMDLRTEGEAAAATGTRFSRIMLTPEQVAVHHSNEPLIFLSGPPGVGKSVMIILKGLDLLHQGLHVDVVSSGDSSRAASHLAVYQLQQKAGPAAARRIHLHHFDLGNGGQQAVNDAVRTLVEAANKRGQGIYVIADEACTGRWFTALVTALHDRVPRLVLWAADIEHSKKPPLLTEVILTQPLRTPPSVTHQVQLSDFMRNGIIRGYTATSCPPPCDGSDPLYRYHTGQGHSAGDDPGACEQCGREVARILTEDLHVGVTVRGRPTHTSQSPLQHRDVFVLHPPLPSVRDIDGFVAGLRQGGLPVTVLQRGDSGAAADVATMSLEQVVVADYNDVYGLERHVVVWVQSERSRGGVQGSDEQQGRLHAMSRCTAQLVCVMPPPESPPFDYDDDYYEDDD